jgi:hypothetical protein
MVRHSHHATNPEKFIPRMFATPVRWPIAASCATVEKLKPFFLVPFTNAVTFVRHDFGLTKRVLCCGWMKFPLLAIRYRRAIAQSPDARPVRKFEGFRNEQSTAFFGTGK